MNTPPAPPSGPSGPLNALRGAVYVLLLYALMLIMGIFCFIPSMLSQRWAIASMRAYCVAALWLLRVIVGTRIEYRGPIPQGPCIIAAKHQSFLDILCLVRILPRPAFVMKKSLRWAPVIGIYAQRLGSIPIDRKAGKEATRTMLQGAKAQAAGRQIIIFPQGTRVAPNTATPYRGGVVRLYETLAQPLVLVALNTGWFWPRTGLRRTPGTVIIEFLETIPAGADPTGLLERIETKIEAASDDLADQAARELRANGLLD